MAILQNARREQFAQELAAGASQRQAYRAAFPRSAAWKDSTVDTNACKLAAEAEISERIAELKAASASDAIIGRQERMILLSNIAMNMNEHSKQRMQAIDILNKMDGDYVKKVEVLGDLSGAEAKVAAILDE